MVGTELGVDMHVVSADATPIRNLMLCVERCHLQVDAVVAAPYASGLAALADDESEIGCTLVDMGGGTTTLAVFSGGRFVHADGLALGGNHVTLDIARGLSTTVDHAERLKTLHTNVMPGLSDDRGMIDVRPVGDEDGNARRRVPKARLIEIARPRVEEILELVRDRLRANGHGAEAGRRVVLTGGACQLTGVSELAARILGRQVRVGRPLGSQGLPDAAKGPAFAGALGLLVYPQLSGEEHFEQARSGGASGHHTYLARMGQWLKESF